MVSDDGGSEQYDPPVYPGWQVDSEVENMGFLVLLIYTEV